MKSFSGSGMLLMEMSYQPMPVDNISQSKSHFDKLSTVTNITVSTSDEIVTEQLSTKQIVDDLTKQAESRFSNDRELVSAVITPVKESNVETGM